MYTPRVTKLVELTKPNYVASLDIADEDLKVKVHVKTTNEDMIFEEWQRLQEGVPVDVEQMTPPELERYLETGEVPKRAPETSLPWKLTNFKTADNIVRCVKDLFDTKDTVIVDLGCELGNMGYFIRCDGYEGDLYGVDIHRPTLEKTQRRGVYNIVFVDDASRTKVLTQTKKPVRIAVAYDVIEHLPLDRVQDFLDTIHAFDICFLSTPATQFGMSSKENPYNTHIRCYDPIEQMVDWGALDFWSCTSGGRLVGLHTRFGKRPEAKLTPTPIKFRGSFSRSDVYKRLREVAGMDEVGKDYARSVSLLRDVLAHDAQLSKFMKVG